MPFCTFYVIFHHCILYFWGHFGKIGQLSDHPRMNRILIKYVRGDSCFCQLSLFSVVPDTVWIVRAVQMVLFEGPEHLSDGVFPFFLGLEISRNVLEFQGKEPAEAGAEDGREEIVQVPGVPFGHIGMISFIFRFSYSFHRRLLSHAGLKNIGRIN